MRYDDFCLHDLLLEKIVLQHRLYPLQFWHLRINILYIHISVYTAVELLSLHLFTITKLHCLHVLKPVHSGSVLPCAFSEPLLLKRAN